MSTLREDALALYTPPFKFLHGYVFDSSDRMVADQGGISGDNTVAGAVALQIRGWGRIGYMPDAKQLQDEIGAIVVDALNAYYAPQGAQQAPAEPVVTGATHGLSQDYSKGLGRWFADRPGARQQLLDDAHEAQQVAAPQKVGDSRFESWYSESAISHERKQAMREAYEAGMNDKAQQVAVPVAWMKFARKKPAVTSLSFSSELSTLEKAHGFVSTPLCHCAPPAEAQQVAVSVPLSDEQIQKIWNVASGSTPGWCRHITYARAIEQHHGVGAKPVAQQVAMPEVQWGVDWGSHGDRSCASIVKKHPDGTLEVVATEYEPQRGAKL